MKVRINSVARNGVPHYKSLSVLKCDHPHDPHHSEPPTNRGSPSLTFGNAGVVEHGFKSLMCFSKRGPVGGAPLPACVTRRNGKSCLQDFSARWHPDSSTCRHGTFAMTARRLRLNPGLGGAGGPLPRVGPSMQPQLLFPLLQG